MDAEPHFEPVFSGNPFLPMNVFVTAAAIDGEALSAGDEVAIMDGDRVVGHVVLEGPIPEPFVSIPASTAEADATNGFVPGNSIAFRLWDASAGMEITAVIATFADLTTGEPIAAPLFASQGQAAVRLEATILQCFDAQNAVVLGEFDGDGKVGFDDYFLFVDQFGTDESSQNWDASIDLVPNGKIDFRDFFRFVDDFGKTCHYK